MAAMQIDPTNLEPRDIYRLMISVIVPRPIAWVSTQSPDGVLNAAPFSYFQALGGNPPMVMIAVGNRRTGEPKDTRRNIEATGEFVVNLVGEQNGPAMVRSSVDHPYGVSEFEQAGLTAVASEMVAPPRIGESRVAMECKLDRVLELAGSGVILGRIVLFHLDDELLDANGHVDPLKLRPLGRLGGQNYASIGELLQIDAEGKTETSWSAKLDLWTELRDRSIAMVRQLDLSHLARVGGIFRHLAACTHFRALEWEGRTDEEEPRPWDSSWDGERIAAELAADRDQFRARSRTAPRDEIWKIDRMIRHEAWHQGQIALLLRDEFAESELWRAQ
jgi:flavin reductase (DIM6/NTAB) family NADH-FMN oxidoreductase RutF